MSLEYCEGSESGVTLQALQRELVTEARVAYQKKKFEDWNMQIVNVVAAQSALLTARAVGIPPTDARRAELETIFCHACQMQIGYFACCFDQNGMPIQAKNEAVHQAALQTGKVAVLHVSSAAQKARLHNTPLKQLLDSVTLEDAILLAMDTLEQHGCIRREEEKGILHSIQLECISHDVRDVLRKLLWQNDYLVQKIDHIPFGSGNPLPVHSRRLLRIGNGLANAAWQVSQINRAKWYQDPTMLTPQGTHQTFNPYDLLQLELYQAHRVPRREHGIIRVALELWKDIREMKKSV